MHKKFSFLLRAVVVVFGLNLSAALLFSETSLDGERLSLEMKMQSRVEEALAKILPAGQYVVVVRVEPEAKIFQQQKEPEADTGGGFYLPGVPTINRYDGSAEAMNRLSDSLRPDKQVFHKFVRRVTATLVLDKDLPEETVVRVRDLTRQLLGLDAARGDTLEIQKTAFQKPVTVIVNQTSVGRFQESLKEYWVIISLSLILFCITVFLLFIFGPLRGFLNRFIQVLPSLRPIEGGSRSPSMESQVLPALLAQALGLGGAGGNPALGYGGGPNGANFSGSLQVENPNKRALPFSFIREDHLTNLSTILSRETPDKAAVVLGYLPSDWIIRVLSKMEPTLQNEITSQLATTRQLLPEQVEDIEQDLKRRLDYMIGGPDRLYSVYESLDPDAQRRMLDNLRETRPEVADDLRKKTFLFEDLEKVEPNTLKTILREVDLQTLVAALKGMPENFNARLLEHLSEGKAQIVREEIEMSDGKPTKDSPEAQKKIALVARRLQKEGTIEIVQIDDGMPATRYGGSLRSSIKLPPGLALRESEKVKAEEAEVVPVSDGIQDRIRKFLNRRSLPSGRFPSGTDKKE